MSELRVGVLALVHGLVRDVEYNGKCVELVGRLTGFNELEFLNVWECSVSSNEQCYFPSKNLLPIGDKDPELEKDLYSEIRKSTEHS